MTVRTLLVTGGAGFIGSNFVRDVLATEPEARVIVLDKLTYAGNLQSLADLRPAGAPDRAGILATELREVLNDTWIGSTPGVSLADVQEKLDRARELANELAGYCRIVHDGHIYVCHTHRQPAVCPHLCTAGGTCFARAPDRTAACADEGRLRFVRGDIADREVVRDLLDAAQPAAIVHFAAESHVDRSIDAPAAFIQTNVVGTFELLDELRAYLAAHPARREQLRFLHVSTDEVFGALGPTGAFTEATAYAPRSPYAASKAASDHLVGARTGTRTVCRSSPRTARTTTARISSPRS